MIRKEKGFTLIELLVVVAIIGILSSVVLASLSSARDKGRNAAIKSALSSARAQSEIDADGGDYSCSTTGVMANIISNIGSNGGTLICGASPSGGIAFSSKLSNSTTDFWCIDSDGYSGPGSTTTTTNVCTHSGGNPPSCLTTPQNLCGVGNGCSWVGGQCTGTY